MWVGSFFKNQKIKERQKTAPNGTKDLTADSAVWFCLIKISADVSDRWSPLMEKESPSRKIGTSCFALLTMHSGVTFGELASSVQPVTRPNPLPDVLTVPIGRMSEPQADDLTHSDARLTLTSNASQCADKNLTIFVVLLKTRVFPEFFVEKTFELRSEVCDMMKIKELQKFDCNSFLYTLPLSCRISIKYCNVFIHFNIITPANTILYLMLKRSMFESPAGSLIQQGLIDFQPIIPLSLSGLHKNCTRSYKPRQLPGFM